MKRTLPIALALLCATTVCISKPAAAYDTRTGHSPLTELAFEAYQSCFPDDRTFSAQNRELILRGNRAMDEGMHREIPLEYWEVDEVPGLFDITVRIFNWHFYNPTKTDTDITRRFLIEQSMRRLWRRAKYGFNAREYADEKALFLGAIIHLVEDVSVPAHVMPTYHGPTPAIILGHFEPLIGYMKKAGRNKGKMIFDDIDKLEVTEATAAEIRTRYAKPGSAACNDLKSSRGSPDTVRDQLAGATLKAMQGDISGCPGVPWETFWNVDMPNGDKDSRYFKRYNVKIPAFGKEGEITAGCVMQANDPRYQAFLQQRHLQAIEADLRLLRWASQQLSTP